MPAGSEEELGRLDPPFQWDTHAPHTVALMLNATEEALVLKACQSLYKFAHDAETNQSLLLQLDVLDLLLGHLRHGNRSVRRMAAMTVCQLASNASVQASLQQDGCLARLVAILAEDADSVVDEFVSGALCRVASEPAGQAALLAEGAVPALVRRLVSPDPDVLKNCLDALLAVLHDFQAPAALVAGGGVERTLALVRAQPPVIAALALDVLRIAMFTPEGRQRLRDVGGLEDLLAALDEPEHEKHYGPIIAVLEHAMLDAKNALAMRRNGGLLRMVQLARASEDVEVLAQCGAVLGHLGRPEPLGWALHALAAEQVVVASLLGAQQPAAQRGGARAAGALALLPTARQQLVELGVVSPLLALLGSSETSGAAVQALATITRGDEAACRQAADGLGRIVDRLAGDSAEAAAFAAATVANLAAQEALRPAVAASRAADRLLACLGSGNAPLLVAACEALGVVCLSLRARRQLVERGGLKQVLSLLQSEYPAVRTAAVRTLQVAAADPAAAEQLCTEAVVGELRRLRATSALKVVLQADLSALYAQFGRLSAHHRLADGFLDVGRQEAAVPRLEAELARPPDPDRLVFALLSGVSPPQPEDPPEEKQSSAGRRSSPSPRRGRDGKAAAAAKPAEDAAPAPEKPPLEDPQLAAYVTHVRAEIGPIVGEREQATALAAFVAEQLGGAVPERSTAWSPEQHLSELRRRRASNVLPVGAVRRAGLRCRALLFKFLADQISVPCTLTRGSYGKYWNTVLVGDEDPAAPPGAFTEQVVDLLHRPGLLMTVGSPDAVKYTTGF